MTQFYQQQTDKFNTWQHPAIGPLTSGNSVVYLGNIMAVGMNQAGFRFTGVTIPQGATIDDAVILFTRQAAASAETDMRFYCEDVDSADPHDTAAEFTGASTTTAFTEHDLNTFWTSASVSGVITTAVQEVIDRAGWVSGNDLVVMVKEGTTTTVDINAAVYGGGTATSGDRPAIRINYTSGGGGGGSYYSGITPMTITGGVYSCSGNLTPDNDGVGKFHYRGDNYDDMFDLGFFPIIESGSTYFRAQNASYSGEYRNISGTPVQPVWKNYYRNGTLGVGAVPYFGASAQTRANNNFRNAIHFTDSKYIRLPNYGTVNSFTVYMHTAPSGTTPRDGIIFSNGNADTEAGAFIIRYTSDVITAEYYTSVGVYQYVESTFGNSDNPHNYFIVSLVSSGSPLQGRLMLALGRSDTNDLTTYESSPFYMTPIDFAPVVGWSGYSNSYEGWLHEFGIASSGWTGHLSTNGVTTINTAYNNNHSYLVSQSGNPADDSTYIEWKVPLGTGLAKLENISYSLSAPDGYQLNGPPDVAPSAVYIEMYVEHNTNHPSGVWIRPQLSFNTTYTPSTLYWNHEVLVPSGTKQKVIARPTNTNSSGINPLLFANVADQTLYLTTQYDQLAANPGYYGELKIYSATVKLDVFCENESANNGIDLYTEGGSLVYNNTTLFLNNIYSSGLIPLFVQGTPGSGNSNTTLFISAATDVGSSGNSLYPSGLRLYINGIGAIEANMNLYTKASSKPYTSGNMNFFLWSTANSGLYTTTPLMLYSNSWEPQQVMPTFIEGANAFDITSNMNLFLENDTELNNSVNFMILGPSGINDDLNLYIGGYGPSTSSGWIPANSNMNLYMARDYDSIANNFSLYMQVTESSTHSFNLFLQSAYLINSASGNADITSYGYGDVYVTESGSYYFDYSTVIYSGISPSLYMSGTAAVYSGNNNFELYTHGF